MTEPGAPTVPLLRRLHVQAAGVVLVVLAALAATMFLVDDRQRRETGLEALQSLDLDLAAYIVAHQSELVDAHGHVDVPTMHAMATQAMMINPAIEVYLLDPRGIVVAHALPADGSGDPVGRRVDLEPVQRLVARAPTESTHAPALQLPVLGTDPRVPDRRTIFSAAALPSDATGRSPGWLYVVLESVSAEKAAQGLARSGAWQESAWTLCTATVLAALVMVLSLRRLTRPLRELTVRLSRFHRDLDNTAAPGQTGEIALLGLAVDAMQQRLDQQLARLQEADRLRRELVGNISHDLRTPLSNVQGYVETVLVRAERLDPDERARHLRTALRHADLLGRRIADLFELSMLDAGFVQGGRPVTASALLAEQAPGAGGAASFFSPKLEVFCLGELLQDVTQGYQLDAGRRNVTLALDAGSHLRVEVRADIALIERVLQNLVDNALRHTPSGGRVTLAIEARGAEVEVSVSDTGSGIAPEHLPYLFERYWRAGDPTAAGPSAPGLAATPGDEGGTVPGVEEHSPPAMSGLQRDPDRAPASSGIGLAIVKRILDLHGSVVRVRSRPREGASFVFVLPRAS
ncbi:MAG TPA: HAMP domain-containing sensor histidine kinase [Burkholderiaceae bacterium]|nr:HAMP domain-containing sensor histidine kinase [Burkholderiaceae bacterium]